MGKKEDMEKLRKRIFDRKKKLTEEVVEVKAEVEQPVNRLLHTAYTIIEDSSKKGRNFLIIKIKFDVDTGEINMEEVREFEDKAAGLSFVMNNNNLKFLFEKNKRRET